MTCSSTWNCLHRITRDARLAAVLAAVWLGAFVAGADAAPAAGDASGAPNFDRDVSPILSAHCVECHGGKSTKSGLNLTTVAAVLKGADSGPVVVAGKSSQSLLAQLLREDADPHMPPKKQLSAAQIATIAKWVDGLSAPAPIAQVDHPARQTHWAYQKPAPQAPPAVKNEQWVVNGIDRFILAKLEAKNLAPAAPATPAELIRRATFDLTGLPPTPQDVAAFEADPSPAAYDRLLDKLLASTAYGQRWGRHWLDLARYADSGGFHNDIDRPNAWRYRDYVIDSFNADKPYGQFVREQLAGDEIVTGDAKTDADALAATAFCRNGPSNEDNVGKDAEKYRIEELDDVISTTSSVFLGLTVGCARCHDHKYDPIPQTDYYRLLAIFNSTTKKDVPLTAGGAVDIAKGARPQSSPDKAAKAGPAVMIVTDIGPKPRATHLLWRGDVKNVGPLVEPGVPVALTDKPIDFPAASANAKTTGRRLALANWIASPDNPIAWRVLANRLWTHHLGRGLVPTPNNLGVNGEPPSHPELLDWLAAQTIANGGRLKAMHKLIMTSATYRQSSRPDSAAFAAGLAIDPENVLLWRANKRRLEAEAVRDSILFVSGNLNPKAGGPGIKPRIPADMLVASQRNKWPTVTQEGPTHWRRSVYIYVKRQLQFPLLELFDAPPSTQTCGLRQNSTVPTQALVLMNDEFTNDQSRYFARNVIQEVGDDPAKQADRAIRVALCQAPTSERLADAVAFINDRRAAQKEAGVAPAEIDKLALADLCHVLINCNEFLYLD